MKPPSKWPPPMELEGKKCTVFRAARAATEGQDRTSETLEVASLPDIFTVIDESVPYVIIHSDDPGRLGRWTDLDADYLAYDPAGNLVFIQGAGPLRHRLERLSITKKQWEAISSKHRRLVMMVARGVDFMEGALRSLIVDKRMAVRNSSLALMIKLAKLVDAEGRPRGLKEVRKEARSFSRGKEIQRHLVGPLSAIKNEGGSLRRNTYSDTAWRAAKSKEVNQFLKNIGFEAGCSEEDIRRLARTAPSRLAASIAARVSGTPGESLRYGARRVRAKGFSRKKRAQ